MKNILIKFKNTATLLAKTVQVFINELFEVLFPKNSAHTTSNDVREKGIDVFRYDSPTSAGYDTKTYAGVAYFEKYKDPRVKKLLWQFKYYLNPRALRWCTYILYDELIAEVSDRVTQTPFYIPYPLVHSPSSTFFKGAKKFDHMKELLVIFDSLQNIAYPFFTACTHAILPNTTIDRAQHTGTRKERLQWAEKRFHISEKFEQYLTSIKSKTSERYNMIGARSVTVYCIDDVVTTGASLKSISKLFQDKFGVQVRSFCLCH